MIENGETTPVPGWKGFLVFLFFFIAMVSWGLFMFFGVPAIQKKYLVTGSPAFVEYQAGFGILAITGFVCFALLVVIVMAACITPGLMKNRGAWIFISVLIVLWLAGIAESIFTYSYITKDGMVMRKLFAPGERIFSWDDVKKIDVSFYNTSSKGGNSHRMMKWDLIPADSYSMTIREYAHGELPLTKTLFGYISNKNIFFVEKDDGLEWGRTLEVYYAQSKKSVKE